MQWRIGVGKSLFQRDEVECYPGLFEVADGEGSFGVVVGDDVVAYVVRPLVEPHYWFEGIGSPQTTLCLRPTWMRQQNRGILGCVLLVL